MQDFIDVFLSRLTMTVPLPIFHSLIAESGTTASWAEAHRTNTT